METGDDTVLPVRLSRGDAQTIRNMRSIVPIYGGRMRRGPPDAFAGPAPCPREREQDREPFSLLRVYGESARRRAGRSHEREKKFMDRTKGY